MSSPRAAENRPRLIKRDRARDPKFVSKLRPGDILKFEPAIDQPPPYDTNDFPLILLIERVFQRWAGWETEPECWQWKRIALSDRPELQDPELDLEWQLLGNYKIVVR